jgi:uncharacterized protein
MMLHENDIAILIFSRTAAAESRYKKLQPDNAVNFHIHTSLLNKTIDTVQATGFPFFVIDENSQKGNGFGERFCNAIENVFDKGFNKIITIGADAPLLSHQNLLAAAHELNAGKTVLGPDVNGGIYLLGISKRNFCKTLLQTVSWNTKDVFVSLQHIFSLQHNHISLLEILHDLNSANDLDHIFSLRSGSAFLILLRRIILQFELFTGKYFYFFTASFLPDSFLLRGPPSFA